MAREIYVSQLSEISVFSAEGEMLRRRALDGAGAICVSGEYLFCAVDEGRAILRLNRNTLMPEAAFGGGPGVTQLLASADGGRLYALCAEADSVLLINARSGAPMVLCRSGCNPQQMMLYGASLVVSGGESGHVHLLDAQSLEVRGNLAMPGPVYSAWMGGGMIHALCMTQTLDALLVTDSMGGRVQLPLEGMPGRLLRRGGELLVSVSGRICAVSPEDARLRTSYTAPGRAAALLLSGSTLCFVDMLSERIFIRVGEGMWKLLCAGVKDAVVG
ncbi:MAG: hypothetical protein IKK34_13150 [Clostridia bacterium]|nr:hypothetical protein [Clostridia bacterium]